jgi:hypothetical protein
VTQKVMDLTGNPHTKFLHCLPAFHNRDTKTGEKIFQTYGIDCMEVTDEVFESPPRSCSIRPRTGCIRSRRCLSPRSGLRCASWWPLGGNALLKRGEPMTAEAQHTNVRIAAAALADLARDHQIIVAHGNGPQVGLMALQAAAYAPRQPLAAGYSRGRDRRHDRLSDRAGTDERPAGWHRLRHAADTGGGRS